VIKLPSDLAALPYSCSQVDALVREAAPLWTEPVHNPLAVDFVWSRVDFRTRDSGLSAGLAGTRVTRLELPQRVGAVFQADVKG
jgi:hypothetical protein